MLGGGANTGREIRLMKSEVFPEKEEKKRFLFQTPPLAFQEECAKSKLFFFFQGWVRDKAPIPPPPPPPSPLGSKCGLRKERRRFNREKRREDGGRPGSSSFFSRRRRGVKYGGGPEDCGFLVKKREDGGG